ncbi:hypothetical protein EMIHUDRAFT_120222 [Emiliania huxleyi CCMP1516]|uniref:Uncharacterized protein n=2 Tax=Emiliania huxleyi TaxID=2903 RepID=A0A0D3IL47_EMIH1|nr:hypothetical protein EMIHUDRAFT_120222 [Emiliania huxleyi CCMP1516]EOD11982.1 hypothetical protein EMIHUDRAFT_120222 [Emiliania huxleyi CCMP1516]|eukprot:XP_005764411.1 hypothetical protein EMIHUDRAFT_120222 [Emiliania huxleyi CCMP1516]
MPSRWRLLSLLVLPAGNTAAAAYCTSSAFPPAQQHRRLRPQQHGLRHPAAEANAFDVWWAERRARNTVAGKPRAVWAQAAAYESKSAEGRARLRAARVAAAAAEAAAAEAAAAEAASPAATANALPLDSSFRWTASMLSGEANCAWSPPLSSSVGVVLTEFVQSDYARAVFNTRRVGGSDYGQIHGMFDSVRLVGTRLELKPRQACENVEGLFDRLAKYLRARIPQIKDVVEIIRDGENHH